MSPVRAGLLGHPVAHSRSPDLFAAAWKAAGRAGRYELVDVPPAGLGAAVRRARDEGWVGFNVTIPHKQAVRHHLDALAPGASAAGAVNCAVLGLDGRIVGHCTDGEAFVASVREEAGLDPAGLTALVLGAGGAARAVALALAAAGARVEASARRPEAAATLPAVAAVRPWSRPIPLDGVELLVHCTPLGMEGTYDDEAWPARLSWDSLPAAALVADLVYAPEVTPLLAEAEARAHPILGGLGMLVRQAEAAYRLWHCEPPPRGAMAAAARGLTARAAGGEHL